MNRGLGLSSYALRWSIGARGYSPPVPMSIRECIETAAGLGLAGVQLCDHLPLSRCGEDEWLGLAELAAGRGLYLQLGCGSSSPERLDPLLGLARRLGVDLVRIVPDVPERQPRRRMSAAESNRLYDRMRQLAESTEADGIKLAFENHGAIGAEDLAMLLNRLGSPRIGACLDTMNSTVLMERPEETVGLLARHALCVHLKDFRIVQDPRGHRIVGTALGEGIVDFPALMGIIERSGARPHWQLELFTDRGDSHEATRAQELLDIEKSRDFAVSRLGFSESEV